MHLIFVGQGYPRKLFNLEHSQFTVHQLPLLENSILLLFSLCLHNSTISFLHIATVDKPLSKRIEICMSMHIHNHQTVVTETR